VGRCMGPALGKTRREVGVPPSPLVYWNHGVSGV